MGYNYLTQYNSPNFTPANETRIGWGVDRRILHIDIHWWDAPENNPSFEGTIATLCNPSRGASAHFVATGTGRRVACLVNPDDNSWCTGVDNPYSISIECDPRCRDEDYDVVAELIANIRSAYGNLSLHGHNEFANTRCPGNWDLNRLEALSRTKDGSGDWGVVTDIVITPPIIIPPIIEPPVVIPPVIVPEPPVIVPEPPIVIEPPIITPPVVEPVEPPKEVKKQNIFIRLFIWIIKQLNKWGK